MNPRTLTRKVRARAEEAIAASAAGARRDRAIVASALRADRAGTDGAVATDGSHVLVASAGAGNIGDQAMVDAFVERVGGPVTIVVRNLGDFEVPPAADDRVTFVALPSLVYGLARGSARRADLAAFGRLLAGARSLSIIGADIMDGRYSPRGSVRRAMLAESAARAGVPSRVLGFSWNGRPDPRALAALRRATAAGVVPYLRDPVSAARARAHGVTGVVDAADLVFTAQTVDPTAAVEFLGDGSRHDGEHDIGDTAPVVLVNASALVGRSVDQAAEYGRVIRALRDGGARVLLVPHVSRPSSDDLAACRAVHETVADDTGVGLVDRLLTPAQIRGLADRAALVVTGRMHLAIMSLRAGVPAITLATQGKVEGLMRLAGVPELCVEPGPDLADRVLAVADRLDRDPSARAAVAAASAPLRRLAERNTEGLGTSADPVPVKERINA